VKTESAPGLYLFATMNSAVKQVVLVLGLIAGLGVAATASAEAKTVTANLTGQCVEVDKLDSLGVLKSFTLTCKATGPCKCEGTTKLSYTSVSVLSGTGAAGHEKGTLVASGPAGSATLSFKGTRTALGVSTGTWTLAKTTGLPGVKFTRHGSYATNTNTLSSVTGTQQTSIKIAASFGCWNCAS
jgi:hypothetical protein